MVSIGVDRKLRRDGPNPAVWDLYLSNLQSASMSKCRTHLHQTQILQTILNQLLYPTLLRLPLMLTERISRFPAGIFTEVVIRELR